MKKVQNKSKTYMNLFLLNSIYSLIFLIFTEIFFFLLDGINTFELIQAKERFSQIIWCIFFVVQLGILKIAEVLSKSVVEKQIACVHYLFIIYSVLLPLSSALLFTSSLSWTKLIYFTQVLSLSTSIKIRRLLIICLITLVTGSIRFHYSLPTSNIIFCFSLLLGVHILISIIVHVALYIFAKQISYIKEKPLRAFDNIEPYFHELEKKAILIRNNLIFHEQNNISVDILGNYLFENEVSNGIKKIKIINKSRGSLADDDNDLINAQYEIPFDISDVNCSSINTFHLHLESALQNESVSSNKKFRQKKKISEHNEKNFLNSNNKDMKSSFTGSNKDINESNNNNDKDINGRKYIKNIQIKAKNTNLFDNPIKDNYDNNEGKNGYINRESYNNFISSQKYKDEPKKYNTIKYSNFKKFNNKIVNKELEELNNKDYGETYKKEIVQKHFSLLRSGHGRFNRRRNILLSEELKNKINYIYFDKNDKIKRSKIIPIYVLERHNLNNLSTYLSDNISIKINNYYKFYMLLHNNSLFITDDDNHEIVNLSSLKSLKNNNIYEGTSNSRSENFKYCYKSNKCKKRKSIIPKYSNNKNYFSHNTNASSEKIFDVLNSKLMVRGEKRRISNYTLNSYSLDEHNEKSYEDMIQESLNNTRVFYLINSVNLKKSVSISETSDSNLKNHSNQFYHFHSHNNVNNNFLKNNPKFHVNKSGHIKNKLSLQESSDNNLSNNEMFYVDDFLNDSVNTNDRVESENATSKCNTSPSTDNISEKIKNKKDKKMKEIIMKKSKIFINKTDRNYTKNEDKQIMCYCFLCKNKNNHYLDKKENINSLSSIDQGEYKGKKNNIQFPNDKIYKKNNKKRSEKEFNKKENDDTYEKFPKELVEGSDTCYFNKCKRRSNENFKKKCNCYIIPKLSMKNKTESNVILNKNFREFYDVISSNYKSKPCNKEKHKFCYNLKRFSISINTISKIFEKMKSHYKKIEKKNIYWKKYNEVLYTSQWKNIMQDNELEYILKYKNFMKWYNYWVKNILFNYYKSTYILKILLYILNALLIYLQMRITYFLLKMNNSEIFKSPNPFFAGKPLKRNSSLNTSIDENFFTLFTHIRIPMQLILNILFVLPSMIIKNYKNIKILNIFAILNCSINIFFGMIDIAYSLNSRIYNLDGLYTVLNYYNMFDTFLVGKLTTSIFLIPFITNFNEHKTCALIYFSCFCYIGTFYYFFNPLEFSIKLMYITNFVLLIAVTISTSYYSKLIMKSRKLLFVKYVLPYFIYLTFLNTDPNIQLEIKEKKIA
ncbi:conserved Plasmodium protein, unknown function [Plasmodium gallinaceum]|uniref:Uncharacterized protein n=1 Tax=Plasmodium gallinaceum TaxID=5849 RepID=A0A1J1H0K3_PLAGA|nr:conserved Plasmodium protein, unknown function [Plasmodium gallinaceum]CRG96813.1 conserved Plasmodium protein, unknown function [Plasmodium gallinaceum]